MTSYGVWVPANQQEEWPFAIIKNKHHSKVEVCQFSDICDTGVDEF